MTKTSKTKAAATADGRPPSKLALLIGLLSRQEGATIAAMAAATGWQAHSVRGAMAGSLKAKGHAVTSAKTDEGRVYRIAAGPDA